VIFETEKNILTKVAHTILKRIKSAKIVYYVRFLVVGSVFILILVKDTYLARKS